MDYTQTTVHIVYAATNIQLPHVKIISALQIVFYHSTLIT